MLIDYERAWHELKASLPEKSGHGTFGPEGLLARMTALESQCSLEEGLIEKALRLFGVEVSSELLHFPNKADRVTVGEPNGTPSNQTSRDSNGGIT